MNIKLILGVAKGGKGYQWTAQCDNILGEIVNYCSILLGITSSFLLVCCVQKQAEYVYMWEKDMLATFDFDSNPFCYDIPTRK